MRKHPLSLRRVFAAPSTIALVTTAGLISALLGDGTYDALSWLALAVPIAVAGFFLLRR